MPLPLAQEHISYSNLHPNIASTNSKGILYHPPVTQGQTAKQALPQGHAGSSNQDTSLGLISPQLCFIFKGAQLSGTYTTRGSTIYIVKTLIAELMNAPLKSCLPIPPPLYQNFINNLIYE